ncbi:Crp/Fnr family transcriptional regulator [Mucilaginibacter aquaedulcis]|uniref:Crp/Fnr family transcriptional regulator n=1 Tax=Mucilaginibacter aquaedulcis TaxID=1187081 RepID=UPI0025B2DA94|nr:Crp/Fnr family transcriptional regulator [Mucilaginibacter aquaedulcis]MDN3551250.1 Crp/Fnr family transcriptional regulator [Mucilaginibacter aquaedulcis]
MLSIEKLNIHFNNFLPLNDEEFDAIASVFVERRIRRKQFLLQQGDVCRHFTFVITGCAKMFAVDQNAKAHNIQFIIENEWATDLSSFYSERPSQLYIEAVESMIVLQISHDDMLNLYTHYPKFDRNFRVIIEQKYIELQDRVLQNISATAEQRYLFFVGQFPHLANRLPLSQIASYLGITPEFLSTIRNNLVKK